MFPSRSLEWFVTITLVWVHKKYVALWGTMTKHGWHYWEAFRIASTRLTTLIAVWYPHYPPGLKHELGDSRGEGIMYGSLALSHHLTGAHTLPDFCPAKTNGDSLNPRLLRPERAINNTGSLRVTEPWPTVSHWHPDKGERQGAACC